MSSEDTVGARQGAVGRQEATQKGRDLGKVALIVGIVALIVSPVSVAGWLVGAAALGLGVAAVRTTTWANQAKIAMILGFAAIVVGTFFFTLNIALG
jgi:hypothetical protein